MTSPTVGQLMASYEIPQSDFCHRAGSCLLGMYIYLSLSLFYICRAVPVACVLTTDVAAMSVLDAIPTPAVVGAGAAIGCYRCC